MGEIGIKKNSSNKSRLDFLLIASVFQLVGRIVLISSALGQARNFLRAMKLEEKAFFYHSNCKEPGIAGLVKVSCTGFGLNPSPLRKTYLYRHRGIQLK